MAKTSSFTRHLLIVYRWNTAIQENVVEQDDSRLCPAESIHDTYQDRAARRPEDNGRHRNYHSLSHAEGGFSPGLPLPQREQADKQGSSCRNSVAGSRTRGGPKPAQTGGRNAAA